MDELNQRLADFFAPVEVEEMLCDDALAPFHEERPDTTVDEIRHWVLDGKTLRGSHRPAHEQEAQSVLTLYDLESQHVVAQRELVVKPHVSW